MSNNPNSDFMFFFHTSPCLNSWLFQRELFSTGLFELGAKQVNWSFLITERAWKIMSSVWDVIKEHDRMIWQNIVQSKD